MQRTARLWIDHRKAVLVFTGDEGEETKRIESGMEKHVRFSGGSRSEQGKADDQRDKQFTGHLNKYYDEVVSHIGDVEALLIFGPGGCEGRTRKTSRMTDREIAAKVRRHFQK